MLPPSQTSRANEPEDAPHSRSCRSWLYVLGTGTYELLDTVLYGMRRLFSQRTTVDISRLVEDLSRVRIKA
jgi:hypothetical protein